MVTQGEIDSLILAFFEECVRGGSSSFLDGVGSAGRDRSARVMALCRPARSDPGRSACQDGRLTPLLVRHSSRAAMLTHMHLRHLPLLTVVLASSALAEVSRVEIDSKTIVADGAVWGEAGAYEALRGRIYFALDPNAAANAEIVDLELAPRNDEGQVEAWGDLFVLRPQDIEAGSGLALLEVSNRGGMASLSYFQNARSSPNPTRSEHFGDGLLMKRGMTLIWVGWQFDVPANRNLRLHVPFVLDEEISGLVRSDWVITQAVDTLDVAHRNHRPYPVHDPRASDNVLTVRSSREGEREVVPRDEWQFARIDAGQVLPDNTRIHMQAGFQPGQIYELVYRATQPAVVGMGLAAVRDTIAYAKHDKDCEFPVDKGVAVGISQTGRFLRHFLHQGFNTDEKGRRAFDGMLIHTAGAGRGSFNHRFAQPSRDAHRYSAFFYPTDLFPFSDRAQRDPVTGLRAGLLPADNLPKIFYTNTGYEYWGRAASLLHTSLDGSADVEPNENARIFHLGSAQHFPVGLPRTQTPRLPGSDVWRGNPIQLLHTERALLTALLDWVERDVRPPASAYPRIDAGTLVTLEGLERPSIPGLAWPTTIHTAYRADYGAGWGRGFVSSQPPQLGRAFPSLVSQVNVLGNEVAGVPCIATTVPLATYTPWNLRWGMAGETHELNDFYGSFVPLAASDDARFEGDSRPSVASLYADAAEYLMAVERAAEHLVDERFLLPEDVDAAYARAEALWDWVHGEH
ncbi:MAG: hypothetical protein ACI841_000085 [Planctomycetota bacterium]|jgi:hypothetical protein